MKTIITILTICIFSLFMQSCKSAANVPEGDDSGISLSEEHSKMDDKVEPFYEDEYDHDYRKDQYHDQDDERRNE